MTTTMRERFDELRKQVAGHYDVALPPEVFSFIEQELKKEREEIVEMIENRIEETKIKKRETPFQDTLFNYEVNVLEEIINTIKNRV